MLPKLEIRSRMMETPIVQGGMGVGVSGLQLVTAVAREGGLGTLSSVFMDWVYERETGIQASLYDAVYYYVRKAKADTGKPIGINVMVGLDGYEDAIRAAVTAQVDFIFLGAHLPLSVPAIVGDADSALVPIVAGARHAEVLCRRWLKHYQRLPDAFVLEGPLAGGHLGYKTTELNQPGSQLEQTFPELLKKVKEFGNIPIIVAGGLWTHQDIIQWLERGAAGCQFGTKFYSTMESGALPEHKGRLIFLNDEDIGIADPQSPLRGSPVGHPFRVDRTSPGLTFNRTMRPPCQKCPLLRVGEKGCLALLDPKHYFCIGAGLKGIIDRNWLDYSIRTYGANASRVKSITTVSLVMNELKGG